ncbi:putative DNA-binding protein (MmcQ/YjbR family) [Leifsonia sp. AK011]|uniref:MmcQ/YjbR family DNA-binding protein n=1 Tax=Leifsonia sp. AK011 TaxID=2723075 RepID=UPI0015CB6BA7|nr:MmcQ/YjbR family DNA-binding protein [Leifsonia sp. AK011]NYF09053.1 putative DNA-binding protein (MmcQ/YjbR family) [Leifsonia sp. AK011]
MAEHPSAFEAGDPLVERVRRLCLPFPEAIEVEAWGHPTFRAGKKIFASVSSPRGLGHAVVFKPDPEDAPALRQDSRIFDPPYWGGKNGWLGIGIDDPDLDWELVAELIDASYRQVALVRQVKLLDAR